VTEHNKECPLGVHCDQCRVVIEALLEAVEQKLKEMGAQ
jgi:hypothetical protein